MLKLLRSAWAWLTSPVPLEVPELPREVLDRMEQEPLKRR
jgi:hypothetical protein